MDITMTIYDFAGRHEVNNISALETVLQTRYGLHRNGFWISHHEERNPVLSLLVAGDLATALYFPYEGHPGFTSVGRVEGLDQNEFTTFSYDTIEQEQDFINSQIITFSNALLAAKDFFASKGLPKSIQWFEL